MMRLAWAPLYLPTPKIFPLWIATSAWNAGSPEPSTTRPFLMSRSYAMLVPPHCPAARRRHDRMTRGHPCVSCKADPTLRGGITHSPRTQLGYAVRDGLQLVKTLSARLRGEGRGEGRDGWGRGRFVRGGTADELLFRPGVCGSKGKQDDGSLGDIRRQCHLADA